MQEIANILIVIPQLIAREGQHKGPRQRPQERIKQEPRLIHPRDARWQRDVGAQHWQVTRKERDGTAIFGESFIRLLEVMTRNQQIFAIAIDKWTSTLRANPVCQRRTDDAA